MCGTDAFSIATFEEYIIIRRDLNTRFVDTMVKEVELGVGGESR